MSAKNIIVCADGTGNKGGYSPDSNVYKIYKMIDKHYAGACRDGVQIEEQVLFYDNGVGTQSNKYFRALSGAFGLGFRRNVCDLYKYLARNYVPGDRIYFFGFSRGASTVRACNGMIAKVGLIKGKELRNQQLDDAVDEAYQVYKRYRKDPQSAQAFSDNAENNHGAVPIQFLGVWDTVVALGFPKRTDITGPLTLLLNSVFWLLESAFDLLFPHSFYYYRLSDNLRFACQALAIDDERTSFWPYVWREKNIGGAADRTTDNVEQVWFAGMHSNVGGGYQRAGMANVALYWMMTRAEHHGLQFIDGAMKQVYDASHIHGRIYDSRAGLAALYRYHPREIESLCKDRLLGDIQLHCSVLERLQHRTANYTPGQIPGRFVVADNAIPSTEKICEPGKHAGWAAIRKRIARLVGLRKFLYAYMLAAIMAVLAYTLYLWNYPHPELERCGFKGEIANVLDYFTPDMFDGLIQVVVIEKPMILVVSLIVLLAYLILNRILKKWLLSAGEDLRHCIIES